MKNYYKAVKLLFGLATLFTVLFAAAYIRGLYCFDNIYSLLDATLPFVPFILASTAGFFAASAKCADEEASLAERDEKKQRARRRVKARETKKIDYERRYIIKTYSRDGISKRHVHARYGAMAKSA